MQTAIDQIRALRALHADGLLSEAEFERRRNALLEAIAAPGPVAGPPRAGSNPGINPGTELGLMAGQLVGPPERRYRLERLVAPGGMGQVWQATDLATRTELGHSAQVALKILAPEAEEGGQVRLLLQEATRARRLAHEHIVRVYDWAQDPATGSHFLIMEYLDGEDLGCLLAREGALPLARVLALLEPVAAALDYAWDRHGLVHRDLKPANVFVTAQGEVKLLDFGIAARVRGAGAERGAHEAPGMSGTPGYRAPEAGAPDLVPARTLDVYAVARMAAQMLSNGAPSPGRSEPPRPDQLDEAVWEALRAGWAPAPADRPESVSAWLARVRTAAGAAGPAGEERASVPAAPAEAVLPQPGEHEQAMAAEPAPPAPALAPLPAPRLGGAARRGEDAQRAARRVVLRAQLAARRAAALDEARREREEAERRALGVKAAAAYLAEQERMRTGAGSPAQAARDQDAVPVASWRDRFLDGEGAGPELVRIGAGRFQMGSPEHERRMALAAGTRPHWLARETPQRWVGIECPFALGRYPVTVGEWRVFLDASGWRGGTDSAAPGFPQLDAHPVVGVSWHDAQAYVRWLAERTGRRYRLPSEAEWEYACRAGSRGPFHFGDGIDTGRANYDGGFAWNGGSLGERRGGTTPVTLFAPNAWGLHDMHGNVWEWVQDVLHDSYEGAPLDGRAWEDGDEDGGKRAEPRRVLRGGCWRYHPRYLRSALRNGVAGTMANDIVGFRVARELGGEGEDETVLSFRHD